MYLMKARHLKVPILDNDTRWHSKLDMLTRLIELKTFCVELERDDLKLKMSEEEWLCAEVMCIALQPARLVTKKVQSEQLTPGTHALHS